MEWPVLGRARVATRKRCLPEDQPGPSKKPRKEQCHWNMKLAMVFEKKQLPEIIEKLMESFLLQPRHAAFLKKYGIAKTIDGGAQGPGARPKDDEIDRWVPWPIEVHPKIPRDKIDRWLWNVFRKERVDVDVTFDIVKPLENKRVIVYYKSKTGPLPWSHGVRIIHAGPQSMRVDAGPNTGSYTLKYSGILELSFHVEYPR